MSAIGPPPLPRYGERSLADLLPSVLAALGMPGVTNVLGLEPSERACILLVDGLGWHFLEEYGELAPGLARAADGREPITAAFPATTATSLATMGTGVPPGLHGMMGYTMRVPGVPSIGDRERALECLTWTPYGIPSHDLRELIRPESIQTVPTLIERAAEQGIPIDVISRPEHDGSALTRATLRGGRFIGADSIEEQIEAIGASLAGDGPRVVSTYYPGVDAAGHRAGVGSEPWCLELTAVDRLARGIVEAIPSGGALFVTADHGMVNLAPEEKLDLGDEPGLAEGVQLLAGEGRARHVHVREGAARDVLEAWREKLGDRMWIVSRDEAIVGGWFGPSVDGHVRERIGDVVAAAWGPVGVFERAVDPYQPTLVGHHGSMTPAEQLVPLLEFRR